MEPSNHGRGELAERGEPRRAKREAELERGAGGGFSFTAGPELAINGKS